MISTGDGRGNTSIIDGRRRCTQVTSFNFPFFGPTWRKTWSENGFDIFPIFPIFLPDSAIQRARSLCRKKVDREALKSRLFLIQLIESQCIVIVLCNPAPTRYSLNNKSLELESRITRTARRRARSKENCNQTNLLVLQQQQQQRVQVIKKEGEKKKEEPELDDRAIIIIISTGIRRPLDAFRDWSFKMAWRRGSHPTLSRDVVFFWLLLLSSFVSSSHFPVVVQTDLACVCFIHPLSRNASSRVPFTFRWLVLASSFIT